MLIQRLNWQWMQMYLWPRVCEEEARRVCVDVHSLRERGRKMKIQLCGWECRIRDDSQERGIPSFHVQGALHSASDTALWGGAGGGGAGYAMSGVLMTWWMWRYGKQGTPWLLPLAHPQWWAHCHQCCSNNCLIWPFSFPHLCVYCTFQDVDRAVNMHSTHTLQDPTWMCRAARHWTAKPQSCSFF